MVGMMIDDNDTLGGEPPRLLIDLAEGRLESSEIEAVEMWLRADGLVAPPPWVLRRAERLPRQQPRARTARLRRWADGGRRFVASLAFDSTVQAQFVGLRASGTHVRRLLYQSEDVEVDLEMTPLATGEQVSLAGQVTSGGADPSGGYLRLTTEGGEWRAALDASGEFRLESLAPGKYKLEVVLSDCVVEVPALPI